MAETQKLTELSTEELEGKLIIRKFLASYFRRGEHPEVWEKRIREVEKELRKRRAP